MPHMLRFHDTDDGTELPNPADVGHAAAWAAERGYWDVATCLMELAHALAEAEAPTPARACTCDVAAGRCADGSCPGSRPPADPRYVDQAAPHPESRLTEALARAKELPHPYAPTCSHGYALGENLAGQRYHLADRSTCDDVVRPACSDHGQPMLQGLRLEDGTYDWHCVCVLGRP